MKISKYRYSGREDSFTFMYPDNYLPTDDDVLPIWNNLNVNPNSTGNESTR